MRPPFTTEQFADAFARYNGATWPVHAALIAAALVVVAAAFTRDRPHAARAVLVTLAGLWLWSGAVYHVGFFSAVTPAAYLFGALFAVQGTLFAWAALRAPRRAGVFAPERGPRGYAGAALVAYALVLYPAIGYAVGHRYPASPTFGVPCPLTIFTLGVLLWARPRALPRWLLAVPTAWALVGTSAALQLGMTEDLALPAAAAAAWWLTLAGRQRHGTRAGWAALAGHRR